MNTTLSALFDDASLNPILRHVAEALRDGLLFVDRDMCVTFANAEAARLLGRTTEQVIGLSIYEVVTPEDLHLWQSALKIQSPAAFDVRMKTAEGKNISVLAHYTPISSAKNEEMGGVVLLRSAVDQSDASVVSARLAAIVESSDDAIISKSLEGIVMSWNRGAERIFGFKPDEIIGKSIMLIIPEDRTDEEKTILERLRRGERIDHFETVRQRKDGSLIDISVTISPIRDDTGAIVGASKVARDITDTKRSQDRYRSELESEVAKRTEDFQRANKELEGFTYSVSHDLRGPLRTIASSCMIMQEDFGDKLPAGAHDELNKQANAAKKMAGLIDDLLKLSRLGRQELRKVDLDVTAMADEIAKEIQHGEKKHDFVIQKGMTAYGDAATIRLLISNLLENAAKFSPADSKIDVHLKNGWFVVEDQGIGFDEQYAERIFMPFERLVLERDYPGTGIGLANAKRIVDRHGGAIEAHSEGLGKGSTFLFKLPEAPKEEAA